MRGFPTKIILNRINFIIWDQDLRSLSSKVNHAVAEYGANKVGVYLVAFDVVPIFIEAQNQPVLSMVSGMAVELRP